MRLIAPVARLVIAALMGALVWFGSSRPVIAFGPPWISIAATGALCWLIVTAASLFLRGTTTQALLRLGRRHPMSSVLFAAVLSTCVSCWAVAFDGQSFLSPRNGVPGLETVMLRDTPLAIPGFWSDGIEDIHSGDVGAMLFHHLPYSLVQEHGLLRDGEFALWNRFNATGQSMPAQGQAMLGDPLNWILWLVGVNAGSYDAKFIVLRIVFASALGLSVLTVSRSLFASVLVTLASPFIGEFVFRINHPAIFSLCWSPVLLLSWLHLSNARPRRIASALVLVVLSNWMMLNSGTVKEAYVSMLMLNAIGALLVTQVVSREGSMRSIRLIALLAVGPLTVLIGTPVWAPLLDAILHGWSAYGEPVANQLPYYEAAGFIDNLFFLVSDDVYEPAVNALLFVGATATLFALLIAVPGSDDARTASKILLAAVAICFAMAFGLVPAALITSVPFLRSIHHVHNTFLTVSITPVCMLAGLGFAQARQSAAVGRWRAGRASLVVIAILLLLSLLFTSSDESVVAILYGAALLASTAVAVRWLERRDPIALPPVQLGVLSIALLLMLGRGAQWGDVSFDRYVFNPKARVEFVVDPPIVRAARAAFTEPVRMVTAGAPLFSGYHAVLGLESIDGPEALQERSYRDLMEALHVPYDWHWRLAFSDESLIRHRGALDMLGVGLVFSSLPLSSSEDLRLVASDRPLYVYARRTPWPRAFFASGLKTYKSIDGLAAIADAASGPFVAVSSDEVVRDASLRKFVDQDDIVVRARDYAFTNNTTSFTIDAPSAGVVYLGESDEPGSFNASVNGENTPYMTANGAFKAVSVPRAGSYRIKFEFWPRHLSAYLATSGIGIILLLGTFILLQRRGIRYS